MPSCHDASASKVVTSIGASSLVVNRGLESGPTPTATGAVADPVVAAMIVDASLVGAACEGTARAEEVVSFYDMRIGAWRPDEVLMFDDEETEWTEEGEKGIACEQDGDAAVMRQHFTEISQCTSQSAGAQGGAPQGSEITHRPTVLFECNF